MNYYETFLKLTIGMAVLIFQINIFGKGNLAPKSAIDLVQNYVLGGIIGGVIFNQDITAFQFTLVLLIWTFIVFVFKYAKDHSYQLKKLIDGSPAVLIENGKINVKEATRLGLAADDLMLQLRMHGITTLSQVRYAIREQNGQITLIKYDDQDFYLPVITNGNINHYVLDLIGRDIDWMEYEMDRQKVKLRNIYLAEYIDGHVEFTLYQDSLKHELWLKQEARGLDKEK
jgi:Predicted membrane protein